MAAIVGQRRRALVHAGIPRARARRGRPHPREDPRDTDPVGYVGCCAAIRDMDERDQLGTIEAPVLVVIGAHDPSTTPEHGEYLVAHIPGAQKAVLDSAHLSNIEQRDEFNRACSASSPEASDERHLRSRHEGAPRRSRRRACRPRDRRHHRFQSRVPGLITRYAWGEIWTRPGLDRKTRSCMVLSAMIALRHWDEFRLHVNAAFNNGLTEAEIKEVILQAAIYCGVPAANHAFKEAAAVIAERAAEHERRCRAGRRRRSKAGSRRPRRCRCGRRSSARCGSPARRARTIGGTSRSI